MRKLIFLICFLGLLSSVPAQEFKGKFMLTAKTAYSIELVEHSTRRTYYGSEIGYFLNRQLLLGLNFDLLQYREIVGTRAMENSQSGYWDIEGNTFRWYGVGLFTKLLFDVRRFTPFVKMGFGFYIPQTVRYTDIPTTQLSYWFKAAAYGKTCFGMNFGAGLQYRLWKQICLQTEGLVTTLNDRNVGGGANGNFTYANLNAGLSIIF